jgi:hypothetical protein
VRYRTGIGAPVDESKAKYYENLLNEYKTQEEALLAKEKEIQQAKAAAAAAYTPPPEPPVDDELAGALGAMTGIIASAVIASKTGGTYVPPSTYTSSSSRTPGGGIDTGTPYDNSRPSGNNPSANNSSQRSGQNTGSKDDDDRAYWQSRRSPAADTNCLQRVKTSSGDNYKNVCNKRISVSGFCYPPKQVQKDYPGKGLYSPNDHSGLAHIKAGSLEAGPGLVILENMCQDSGRRYMMLVCDASTNETQYSHGYPDSPDLRTYSCFK